MSTWRHWRLSGVGVWNQLNMCNVSGSYACDATASAAADATAVTDVHVVVIAAF